MRFRSAWLAIIVAAPLLPAFLASGCSNGSKAAPIVPAVADRSLSFDATPGKYIKHIVIVVQENRSFDNLFATFPNADGATQGKTHDGKIIQLKVKDLAGAQDINHDWKTFYPEYDNGKMDGFDLCKIAGPNIKCGTYAYQYVNPSQIQPYWTLAQQYGLADHMFQTQGSGSFTAHQDLIAGTTAINSTQSLIDYPSNWTNWDCDASKQTKTSLMDYHQDYLDKQGPFPCLKYPTGTLADLLDAKKTSWKYYAPPYTPASPNAGTLWNAFAAIHAVRYGPDWNNISTPETNIFTDITNGQLPALSWLIPEQPNSDHPNGKYSPDYGPSWVAQVVNAVGQSPYWNSTAICVLWDDWGGFYDHEPPPILDKTADGTVYGLGFRVPLIVISPYVPAGKISHTQYEFGSILKFVETTFSLGSLGTTDVRATSIGNMFNFKQKPRPFKVVPAKRSRQYFLHQPESNLPVDSD
ncbi:MAG: alkaline phosphatase family protein [Candidatus Tumulicola sp.]